MMKEVKMGDTVTLTIEGKLDTGQVFFKTDEKPTCFVIGEHEIFPALEDELVGMKIGETKTVTLEPKDAFGEHTDDLVMSVSRDKINPEIEVSTGKGLVMNLSDGRKIKGIIVDISDDDITVDFNHPLAGKKIIMTCTLESIQDES